MHLNAEEKKSLIAQYGSNAKNTGDTRVQVALLTHKINHLTGHLKSYKTDWDNRNTLLKYVGRRRRLLRYLQETNLEEYRTLIKALGLRH